MPLATICRQVAMLVGVAPAVFWTNNDDVGAAEIVGWVQEAQASVAGEHDWQASIADLALATSAVDEQSLDLPLDLVRLVPDSVFLFDSKWPVTGPLLPGEWERRRLAVGALDPCFTLSGGALLLRTVQGGGNLVGRYVAAVPNFVADTSVSALGIGLERLIMLCAVALYRDSKGLSAGFAAQRYAAALAQARARDLPIGDITLSMARRRRGGAGVGTSPNFILDGGSRMT